MVCDWSNANPLPESARNVVATEREVAANRFIMKAPWMRIKRKSAGCDQVKELFGSRDMPCAHSACVLASTVYSSTFEPNGKTQKKYEKECERKRSVRQPEAREEDKARCQVPASTVAEPNTMRSMNTTFSSLLAALLGIAFTLSLPAQQPGSGAQQGTAPPPQPTAGAVTVQEDVPYASINGSEQRLDIYQPADRDDALRPAVVLIHGGGWTSLDISNDVGVVKGEVGRGRGERGQGRRAVAFISTLDAAPHAFKLEPGTKLSCSF